jgi:hypothetical protein
MSYLYRYCGLTLDSELALPELPAANATAERGLTIRCTGVPTTLAEAHRRTLSYEIAADQALWRLEGVARYRVSDGGRLIDVEPAPNADPAAVRLFLLHPVFALASVMRGDYLLNASAVCLDGQVTAFVGPSASGKSTAAALLTQSGAQPVSDALLRISFDADGITRAHPQAPWLQLWPDAIRQLAISEPCHPLRDDLALCRLSRPGIPEPAPLARIALLSEQRGNDLSLFSPSARRGGPAFATLSPNTAGNLWIDAFPAMRSRHFRWLTQLTQAVRCERLDLPWGWRNLPQLRDALNDWVREMDDHETH